ncbi:hypothetical protein MMC07_004108 [Pseudocyphellaria aurata]|nr:hypothetical protein [Pseudocyphellaria aurata]
MEGPFPHPASQAIDFEKILRHLVGNAEARPQHSHQLHHFRSFIPKFDFVEKETVYELHGELPGIKQENIDMEFVDSETLVIKGRSERDYITKSIEEDGKPVKAVDAKPHKATVEDDNDDSTSKAISTESDTVETRREEPSYLAWVSERSVGEFHRTFTFRRRINPDAVKANLKNGILTVLVPKQPKETAGRKITIGS